MGVDNGFWCLVMAGLYSFSGKHYMCQRIERSVRKKVTINKKIDIIIIIYIYILRMRFIQSFRGDAGDKETERDR